MSEQFIVPQLSEAQIEALRNAKPGTLTRVELVPNESRYWWQFWKPRYRKAYWSKCEVRD